MKKFILTLGLLACFHMGVALAMVNINTAGAESLTTLPNIGDTKAMSIVEDRDANGPYESLDELTRVNGIGNKTVDGLRDKASVGDSDEDSMSSSEASD